MPLRISDMVCHIFENYLVSVCTHHSQQKETSTNTILQSARHSHGLFGLEFQGTCFQQSPMDLVPSLEKISPHLTPSIPVPENSLELNQYGTTVA